MRAYDAYTDGEGVKWELMYEDMTRYETDESGAPLRDERGEFISRREISNLVYRKDGDEAWLPLPPWADVRDDAKITLCFFEEDEQTEEMTFIDVVSTKPEEPVGVGADSR